MASPLQDEDLYPSNPNTYIWSQTDDQLTVSFLVLDHFRAKDMEVTIESTLLKAGVRGQEPVVKGKLYSTIRPKESLWQLDKPSSALSSLANSPALSSSGSSFAFITPPLSPNTSLILPPPAMDLPPESSDSGSINMSPLGRASHRFRVVTIHLEKGDDVIWPMLVTSGITERMDLDATSAYHLGVMFESQRDAENSYKFYLHAAEHGHTKSMLKVAAMYEIGNQASIDNLTLLPVYPERDPRLAFSWHKRAADLSNDPESGTTGPDPEACYIVGMTYVTGVLEAGIARDYIQALRYFNRAMVLTVPFLDIGDHDAPTPRNRPPETVTERFFCSSAFQSGLIYLEGTPDDAQLDETSQSIAADPVMAIEYWRRSAVVGHAQSAFNVGIMHLNGNGMDMPDRWEAARWFTRARKLDVEGSLRASMPETLEVEWDAKRPGEEIDDEGAGSSVESLPAESAATTERGKMKRKKSQHRKKSRSKASRSRGDEGMAWKVTAAAVVSTGAVIGVAWLLWKRLSGASSGTGK
ncbi:hypothetical protein BC938DRAFT_475345 [Jimgerdemannia flammicorona]|uniref:CS domain-containing protein n=1 Tax=Jimgerdemannia flammicorona TaxID=994334 RepID=A0A433QRR6_9FUNG|nr:hypothetical protein BC938DRAFT_475345 [Jimgerdemannia flammicorona]